MELVERIGESATLAVVAKELANCLMMVKILSILVWGNRILICRIIKKAAIRVLRT